MCSGLMVVGHRLDCCSLLSVVFAVFPRSPRSRFPRTGHPLTLSALILPMRTSPTWPLCDTLLARISLSVVSLQFLSRTALNVSLLRYIAFVFRLPVYPVPLPWGSWTCVSKGVEGKSRRRYIRTNILHPHSPSLSLQHPHSTYSYPPRLFPLSPRPLIVVHRVADCLFISLFVSNCCDLSCARPYHVPGGLLHPP
jgi:hypothetical protein